MTDKLEKFEMPSWKDLVSVGALFLAGMFMGFSYFWFGPLFTLFGSLGIIFMIAIVAKLVVKK